MEIQMPSPLINSLPTRLLQPERYANIYGKCDPRFNDLKKAFARIQPAKKDGGSSLTVFYQGKLVVDIYAGHRDKADNHHIPWQSDTLSLSFSCGKAVLATLAHILVSDGVLDYDKPVAHYWQAFAQNGKADITLRHLLCHESGLTDIRHLANGETMYDWQEMLLRIEKMPPSYPTGKHVAYQAITFGWLVGGLIEKATGQSLTKVLNDRLLAPLNISNDFFFGVPDGELHRVAKLVQTDALESQKAINTRKHHVKKHHNNAVINQLNQQAQALTEKVMQQTLAWRGILPDIRHHAMNPKGVNKAYFLKQATLQACMPAINGTFTTRAMATIYAMLANGGHWQGKQYIKPDVFAQASKQHNNQPDQVMLLAMKWRLGYHKVLNLRKSVPTAFGHSGYNGSMSWCDTQSQLAFSYTHNFNNVLLHNDLRVPYLNQCALNVVKNGI